MTNARDTARAVAVIALAVGLLAGSSPVAAARSWTIRADANAGLLGVRMSSDSTHKVAVPLVVGQVVAGFNLEHVSLEYGVGGPIFAQSLGARVRPLGFRGKHALYAGADYVVILGAPQIAQFASVELGYEFVAGGGLTLVAGAAVFVVITSFKDDETSGAGPRLRLGLGYSF